MLRVSTWRRSAPSGRVHGAGAVPAGAAARGTGAPGAVRAALNSKGRTFSLAADAVGFVECVSGCRSGAGKGGCGVQAGAISGRLAVHGGFSPWLAPLQQALGPLADENVSIGAQSSQ